MAQSKIFIGDLMDRDPLRRHASKPNHDINVFEIIYSARRLALEIEHCLIRRGIGDLAEHRSLTGQILNWAASLEDWKKLKANP